MPSSSDGFADSRVGLVPVAADGSVFDTSCSHADGSYRIGAKGREVAVPVYEEAIDLLRRMPVAYWRRPSAGSGRLGIVRAVGWIDPAARVK